MDHLILRFSGVGIVNISKFPWEERMEDDEVTIHGEDWVERVFNFKGTENRTYNVLSCKQHFTQ